MGDTNLITLNIDGEKISVAPGTTLIEAARLVNIDIPHLCYLKGLLPYGSCGICLVEVEGERNLTRSCVRECQTGMDVRTNTPKLRDIRKILVELLMSNHPADCFSCERNQNCGLLDLANELGVKQIRFDAHPSTHPLDRPVPAIVRNPNKCILCGRCVRVCNDVQTTGAIDFANRGADLCVTTGMDKGLGNVECVNCGQCIHVCPVAAIKEKTCIDEVWLAPQ